MTDKQSNHKCRAFGVFSLMLLVVGVTASATPVSADDCDAIGLQADKSLALVESAAGCATSAWDPTSSLVCLPNIYSGDNGDSFGSDCGTGSVSTLDNSGGQCGYGWAQQWRVSVELHQGDAEVTGWVNCNSKEKAKCFIEIGGAKVYTDDGGSERGPIGCEAEIGEIAQRPVEGVVKCTDPVNPHIVISKTFNITASLAGPLRL